MFKRILVANRGEIALRVMKTARAMGVETVAVFSDADAEAPFVRAADRAVRIGPGPAAESYLRADRVIEAALATGAQAIHPGYGFLSENAAFAEIVAEAGLRFIGPSPEAIRAMGLKDAARKLAAAAGAPVIPGYDGEDQDPKLLAREADRIGYPVMIKARAGGGGKGMRAVERPADFADALTGAVAEAKASFGDGAVLIEKRIVAPRHIEVQVFGDDHGGLVHLYERDCSLQRRHQKVIEEAPAPGVDAQMRAALTEAALAVARAVRYSGAGTVEFIADASEGVRPDRFYFLEMNTRLQVEHPVTERITGLDLVEWQLRVAAGEPLPLTQEEIPLKGWAVEARIYAEDPAKEFAPSVGRLSRLDLPADQIRVDAGVEAGQAVTPFYDPMIAKAIADGPSREGAFARLASALDRAAIGGVESNLAFLTRLLRDPDVRAGRVETGLIAEKLTTLAGADEPMAEALALAGLAALDAFQSPAEGGPWARLRGYRSWGAAERTVLLSGAGVEREIRVAEHAPGLFRITLAEAEPITLQVLEREGARVGFEIDGLRREARLWEERVAAGRRIDLRLDGETARLLVPDPLADRQGAAGAEGDAALTPMPGLIRAVLVAVGEAVEEGQALVEMEAMKMALTLRAPRSGAVADINVAPGDQVAEGAAAVTLEPVE